MTWLPWLLLVAAAVVGAWRLWRRCRRMQATMRDLHGALEHARHEQERLAGLLDAVRVSAQDLMLVVDGNGRVAWMSDSVRGLQGEEPHPSLAQWPLATSLLPLVQRAFREGREQSRQFQIEDRVYWARALPLKSHRGWIALTVEDVTELQRLGRVRRDFVANISHDLRTPITTIQLLLETLQAGGLERPKKARKLLDRIADQTLTLQQLAQELMDLSMIESGRLPLRLAPTPLAHIIEPPLSRLETQIEHKSLRLQRDYDPELRVLADVDIAQRVIQNLLHNAIKFTPEGGAIVIGARPQGEDVLLFLQDSGPGIPPEHLDRIFERFYKTDPARRGGGSGLGLAIAKHIVEGHGGRIWAESAPGEGATFFFTLLRDV